MEMTNFVKNLNRMCNTYHQCEGEVKCPFKDKPFDCNDIFTWIGYEKEVCQIIEDWVKDNPPLSRQSFFLKFFPTAQIDNDGYLNLKPCQLGFEDYCNQMCSDCRAQYWSEEIDDTLNF